MMEMQNDALQPMTHSASNKKPLSSLGSGIKALLFLGSALWTRALSGQTAAPTMLPPAPSPQPTVDRLGIDRTSGIISDPLYERIAIGNELSGLSASYGATGALNHAANLQIERVSIRTGGFIVIRATAGGSTHTFTIGNISQTNYPTPAPGRGQIAWTFTPTGPQRDAQDRTVYSDANDDGALLSCFGDPYTMYHDGECSLLLGTEGRRYDFKMPNIRYDLNLRNWDPGHSTTHQIVLAWPTRMTMADGEVLTYHYKDYADYDDVTSPAPNPSKWNAIESSLGFRIYLSGDTPTGSNNPGALRAATSQRGGGSLHAINLAQEYADPLELGRIFGPSSLTSVRDHISAGYILKNNGIPLGSVTLAAGALTKTKPNGGATTYQGIRALPPYRTLNGPNPANDGLPYSTPSGAFPFSSIKVVTNSTTEYSISFNKADFRPERYQVVVGNPDGSTEELTVRFGLLQSTRDGLGRSTSYSYNGEEGYFYGIPGYARIARLSAVTSPNGNKVAYTYSHGAVASMTVTPSNGSKPLTTVVGLSASCTTDNYRTCNKPRYIRDPNDGQTDFSYDDSHGGLLTETRPADASGVRPQKRYGYSQLMPRHLGAGGRWEDGMPVWRLVRESECTSATATDPASCVGTSAERVTVFAYDSPNLFLTSRTEMLGDGSEVRTYRYTYNYAGDLIIEDGPRTDLDDRRYSIYDVLRRKTYEIGPDPDENGPLPRAIIHHVYDADGNEVRTEYGTGRATDGSDFVLQRSDRLTYDAITGAILRKEAVLP